MDRVEEFIQKNVSDPSLDRGLDVDEVLRGTHRRIRRRSLWRRAVYSSTVAILLVMTLVINFSPKGGSIESPGRELFIADWDGSWTETEMVSDNDDLNTEFFDRSVDYIVDDPQWSGPDDVDELLGENDLEALLSYLKEV